MYGGGGGSPPLSYSIQPSLLAFLWTWLCSATDVYSEATSVPSPFDLQSGSVPPGPRRHAPCLGRPSPRTWWPPEAVASPSGSDPLNQFLHGELLNRTQIFPSLWAQCIPAQCV